MRGFASGLSFAFLSVVLLAGGLGHALRFARFRSVLSDHRTVPHAATGVVAAVVTGAELLIGAAFAAALFVPATALSRVAVTVASLVLGVAFLLYLGRVLQQPPRALSCGCSFLSGQLTPVSLVPAVGLVLASVIAIAMVRFGGEAAFIGLTGTPAAVLSIGWGATLAILVLVLPAAVAPRVEVDGR